RPAIVKQDAWVRLPAYSGLRPNGQPYELHQPRGDLSGLPGTTARVVVHTQKQITKGTIELLGQPLVKLLRPLPGPWADTPGLALGGFYTWLAPVGVL